MNNIVLCPICNGKENGCDYCEKVGYIIKDGDNNYSIKLDNNDQPQKSNQLGDPSQYYKNHGTESKVSNYFGKSEPHDILWFFKDKLGKDSL